MTSVIFGGDKNLIGKIVSVKIKSSNQNSLFGEINLKNNFKAA
jgi:tRNA A37 methylthiotransferase MiaB